SGAFSDKNVGSNKAVSITGLSLWGSDAGNYTVNSTATTAANITAATLTVSGITAGNKVYGATTTATINTSGAILVGVVGGDSVALGTGSASGAFANKNVGSN